VAVRERVGVPLEEGLEDSDTVDEGESVREGVGVPLAEGLEDSDAVDV